MKAFTFGQWFVLLGAVAIGAYFLFVDTGPGAGVWALVTIAVAAFFFQGLGDRRLR